VTLLAGSDEAPGGYPHSLLLFPREGFRECYGRPAHVIRQAGPLFPPLSRIMSANLFRKPDDITGTLAPLIATVWSA
jgi:hypothetical protein